MKVKDQIEQVERELAALENVCANRMSRMHYETVADIITNSGLPYRLVQDYRDFTGKVTRHYRYRWTSTYNSPASLYIQETDAGRVQHRSMDAAIDALRKVLNDHLYSLKGHYMMCEVKDAE